MLATSLVRYGAFCLTWLVPDIPRSDNGSVPGTYYLPSGLSAYNSRVHSVTPSASDSHLAPTLCASPRDLLFPVNVFILSNCEAIVARGWGVVKSGFTLYYGKSGALGPCGGRSTPACNTANRFISPGMPSPKTTFCCDLCNSGDIEYSPTRTYASQSRTQLLLELSQMQGD